jgi:hypothetical protein
VCGKQLIATFRSKEVRMRVISQNNMADSEQDGLSDDEHILPVTSFADTVMSKTSVGELWTLRYYVMFDVMDESMDFEKK